MGNFYETHSHWLTEVWFNGLYLERLFNYMAMVVKIYITFYSFLLLCIVEKTCFI